MINMRTKYLILINFLIAIVYCQAQKHYEEGVKEYFNGHDSIAIRYFNLAIENNDNLSNSYMMRGAAHAAQGKYLNASNDLSYALKLDSNNAKAYFYYGRIYFMQKFYLTAIKYYNISIQKNKSDSDVYDDRAISKFFNEDYYGAIEDENIAIKLNPKNYDYYNTRGYIKIKIKKYEEAINDFDLSLNLKSTHNPKANANKGLALYELGRFHEAIKYFTSSLVIINDDPEVLYYRGLCYLKTEHKAEACNDLIKSYKLGKLQAKDVLDCPIE